MTNYYTYTQYAYLAVEFENFQFEEGVEYTIATYIFNNNYEMIYTSPKHSVKVGDKQGTNLTKTANVELPGNVSKVDLSQVTGVSHEGISPFGNQGGTNLFDGNQGTKICGTTGADGLITVYFSTTEATTLTYYTLVTGNDSKGLTRNPEGWTLYGKNGDEWVELSKVVGDINVATGIQNANYAASSYKVDNVGTYTEYKIVFVETSTSFQLSEMDLYQ